MITVFRKLLRYRADLAAESDAVIKGVETVEVFYLLNCLKCDDQSRPLPIPFESAAARGKWASEHAAGTGHNRWLVREETSGGRWYGGYIAVEAPAEVTRVRSLGSDSTVIRGAECEFCGPGHSHWAYVPAGASGKPPSADSTRQDEGGWYCWLDLDSVGALVDDTENDHRVDKESVA